MSKSNSTNVSRKRNLRLCTKVIVGCGMFMSKYASLYLVLCSIERSGDGVLAADSNPSFDENDFKDIEGFQGARWIRGKEALKIIENIRKNNNGNLNIKNTGKGANKAVHPNLENIDMANVVKQAMEQAKEAESSPFKTKSKVDEKQEL